MTLRSSIPHFNPVVQEIWKLQVEICVHPYLRLKHHCNSASFYETHTCLKKKKTLQNTPAQNFTKFRQTSWSLMLRQGRTLSPHMTSFPDDEDRDGSRNIGSLSIQPPDAAASRRIFYWIYRIESCKLYTVCPSRYRIRPFFNNPNTNEDIAKKFEQQYVHCVRNEKECVQTRYVENPFIQWRLVFGVGCSGGA